MQPNFNLVSSQLFSALTSKTTAAGFICRLMLREHNVSDYSQIASRLFDYSCFESYNEKTCELKLTHKTLHYANTTATAGILALASVPHGRDALLAYSYEREGRICSVDYFYLPAADVAALRAAGATHYTLPFLDTRPRLYA